MFTNKKKKYFIDKLDAVEKTIWDLEFKRTKTRSIREEVRVEYDTTKARLELINNQIKEQKEKPTMPEGDIKRLDDEKILIERDLLRYESQMKSMDLEVSGSQPNKDYPDGVIGIDHQLESLRELKGMIKEYIATL